MTTEYVYLTKKHGDFEAGQFREVDAQQAQDIKAAGAGHIADMSAYKGLQEKATAALNRFKSLEKKLKHSTDPRDGSAEVKAYVIKEAEAELAKEIAEIDAEWEEKKAEIAEKARQSAATYTINVTSADNTLGQQFANRYAMQLATKQSVEGQKAILDAMVADIERMTDSQRVALQPHLLALNSVVKEGAGVAEVYRAASQMQSPEAVQVEAVSAYPLRPSVAYHQMMIVRKQLDKTLAER